MSSLTKMLLIGISLIASLYVPQTLEANADKEIPDFIVPGFEVWDQSHRDWEQERKYFFSQSEIPWISTWAKLTIISVQFPTERDITHEQLSEKLKAVNAVFMDVGTDLHSLVALANACLGRGYTELCRKHKVYERIITLDPENVMAHMIPITVDQMQYYGSSTERAINADSPEIRRLIISASKLTKWERYEEKLLLEYYRTNLDFVSEHPPPTEKQRQVPDHVIAFMNGERAPLYVLGRLDKVSALCRYYQEEGLEELVEACKKLATILRENYFAMGYKMESARLFLADPFSPESLYLSRKADIFEKVRTCLETKWMDRKSLWPTINRATIENFITDVALYGRWEATKNASIAEYDSNPSLYALDPRECEAMLELKSDKMGQVLGDQDPLHGRLEYQKRVDLIEEYATHVTPDERMMAEIDKLDTIKDVGDPLVEHLGSHGEVAIPFLFEKLCVERRLTALSAAYAISSNPSESTLFDLLEAWTEQRSSGQYCETVAAIGSIFRQKESQHRKPEIESYAADYDALLHAIYCDIDEGREAADKNSDAELPEIVVFSEQVANKRGIECELHSLETRPFLDRFERRDWAEERPYYSLRVNILDLPETTVITPEFEATYGSRPIALADVFQGDGSGGYGHLWVKTKHSWIKIQDTYSMVQ